MATPKGNRRKDVFGSFPLNLPPPAQDVIPEPEEIPPSSVPRIPSSLQKPAEAPSQPPLPRRSVTPTIEQTPTRGPAKHNSKLLHSRPASLANARLLTPSKSQRPSIASKLHAAAKPRINAGRHLPSPQSVLPPQSSSPAGKHSPPVPADLQETPVKAPSKAAAAPAAESRIPPFTESMTVSSSPPPPPPPLAENNISIYDALGWNDFDELS